MVFPEPVPPLINMLYFALTNNSSFSAISAVIEPYCINLSIDIGTFENLRMVTIGPFNATGFKTTLTREPSFSLVSTIGFASFTSLPAEPTIL